MPEDIRHYPDLKMNLISLSTLGSKGYNFTSECEVLEVSRGSLVVIKGQKKTSNLRSCRVLQSLVM